MVSIHAPARGATLGTRGSLAQYSFQSTPPRGGRLSYLEYQTHFFGVSIHAPARGATLARAIGAHRVKFQSTPPRGGRLRIQKVAEY